MTFDPPFLYDFEVKNDGIVIITTKGFIFLVFSLLSYFSFIFLSEPLFGGKTYKILSPNLQKTIFGKKVIRKTKMKEGKGKEKENEEGEEGKGKEEEGEGEGEEGGVICASFCTPAIKIVRSWPEKRIVRYFICRFYFLIIFLFLWVFCHCALTFFQSQLFIAIFCRI